MKLKSLQYPIAVFLLALTPVCGHAAALNDPRLRSCDTAVSIPAALESIQERILVEPIEVIGLSLVLYLNGRQDESVFWYYAGLLRARQQLLVEPKKEDEQQFILVQGMVGATIESYAGLDVAKLIRTIEAVQAWDRKAPNRFLEPIKASGRESDRDGILRRFDAMKAEWLADRTKIEARERARVARGEDYMTEVHRKACSGES